MISAAASPVFVAKFSLHGLACQVKPVQEAPAAAVEAGGGDAARKTGHGAQSEQQAVYAESRGTAVGQADEAPCPACGVYPCACQAMRNGGQSHEDDHAASGNDAQASEAKEDESTATAATAVASEAGLSDAERQMVLELKQRDQEVRAHEQAHVAAAGGNVQGGINYEYQTGPDGRQYAVGGSVNIDTSEVAGDPDATIEKARTVRRAALAPASPSGQDRAVAARASQMEAEARVEKQSEEADEEDPASPEATSPEALAEKQQKESEPGRAEEPDDESIQEAVENRRRERAMQAYSAQIQGIEAREPEFNRAA